MLINSLLNIPYTKVDRWQMYVCMACLMTGWEDIL